jgi:hypothetical protein
MGSKNDFIVVSDALVHSVGPKGDSWGQVVLFIADTDNHRIRRIDCVDGSGCTHFTQSNHVQTETPVIVNVLADPLSG